MKKLIIVAVLAVSSIAFSQQRNEKSENIEKKSPEERAENQLKKMTADLNLDAKQAADVRELLLNQSLKRQEKMASFQANKENGTALSKDDKKAAFANMKQNQAEMTKKMKAILNADQFEKWEKNREGQRSKMIEKMKERRGAQ